MNQSKDPLFHVVLVEPEIPHNTGNIGRTCVAMNSRLHIVGPASFSLDEKQVRRAGLDYWQHLSLKEYKNFSEWESKEASARCFYFTTKSQRSFFEQEYQPGDTFVFGPETRGLSADILQKYQPQLVTIPMIGTTRSLNLSNAVAVAIYEAYRQVSKRTS
jgi:tRNA (cytidine/uridine-2'-O-)-methyltransferase